MTPEQKARLSIDKKLEQSGWTVQDLKQLNPMASLGIAGVSSNKYWSGRLCAFCEWKTGWCY
ncbi:MAG: hypothetical protein ACLTW9_29630 [Enterocloster sp.]